MRKIYKKPLTKQKLVRVRKEVAEGTTCYTVRQKRCWALVSCDLQKFIGTNIDWASVETVRKSVPLLDNGNYEVEILPQHVVSKGHSYAGVLETLRKMTEVWIPIKHENGNEEILIIFNKYREENGRYFAQMNIDALRIMITLKNGFFSTFHVESFLKLSTTYSMDLFLYLSQNFNRVGKEWTVPLETLKKRVGCPSNYDFDKIKEKVLEPSKKEFKKQNALLDFEFAPTYSEESLTKRTRGRKKIDCVTFHLIQTKDI